MFRRQSRAIFRGIFKPNFLLSWPYVMCVVQLLFRELLGGSIYTTIQRRQQTNKRATHTRDQPTIQTSADQH
jgi:hypothetical protein